MYGFGFNPSTLYSLLCITVCTVTVHSYQYNDWNYWGPNGDHHWDRHFKNCKGRHQSPVNIETERIVYMPDLQLSFINYDRGINAMNLINNGHGVKMAPSKKTDRRIQCFVTGSALYGEIYRFLQLHFHWRNAHSSGSEHAIDGAKYTMEMHLVHQNIKYDKEVESKKIIRAGDGFTVLAIFFNESDVHNPALDPIIEHMSQIERVHQSHMMEEPFRIGSLLPPDLGNFYRYSGSYTTPDCQEIVTWVIFPKPLDISVQQMQHFHDMIFRIFHPNKTTKANLQQLGVKNEEMLGYYRHIQELGSRRIYAPLLPDRAHHTVPTFLHLILSSLLIFVTMIYF